MRRKTPYMSRRILSMVAGRLETHCVCVCVYTHTHTYADNQGGTQRLFSSRIPLLFPRKRIFTLSSPRVTGNLHAYLPAYVDILSAHTCSCIVVLATNKGVGGVKEGERSRFGFYPGHGSDGGQRERARACEREGAMPFFGETNFPSTNFLREGEVIYVNGVCCLLYSML